MPTTTKFIWDEQNYLAEADGTDTINVVYTNEPQRYGNLISTRISSTTSYHQFDALGSTSQLTNAAAAKTNNTIYDSWGNVVTQIGASSISLRWIAQVGYYSDFETSAICVRHRAYLPHISRWSATDPIWPLDGINWYVYATNSPLHRIDPAGLACAVGDGFIHKSGRGTFRQLLMEPFDDSDLRFWQSQRVGSSVTAIWELRGTMRQAPDEPFGPVVPDPNSPWRSGSCCCCDRIGYVQVAHSVISYGADIPWGIDKAIPYPNSSTASPCEGITNRITMRDAPNATAGWLLQRLDQEFETCVACLGGVERPRWTGINQPPLRRFVTYGCFTWSQTLVRVATDRPGGIAGKETPYFVRRSIEIGGQVYLRTGATPVDVPTPVDGDPPTSDFRRVLMSSPAF